MNNNYRRIGHIRKDLLKLFDEIFKDPDDEYGVEFDVHSERDDNKNSYAYVYVKDYSYEGDFEEDCKKFYESVRNKYKNVYLSMSPYDGGRKMLIFIPQKNNVSIWIEELMGFER